MPGGVSLLTNLLYLDISDNGCQRIEIDFSGMTCLKTLIIKDNLCEVEGGKLESIILSNTISDLRSLTHLDLSNNDLLALPTDIGRLQNLEFLDIEDCRLGRLQASISQLAKLKTLYAKDNGFIEIIHDIGDMRSLTHLDMFNNDIAVIPASICNLVHLKFLCISPEHDAEVPIGFDTFIASSKIEYTA